MRMRSVVINMVGGEIQSIVANKWSLIKITGNTELEKKVKYVNPEEMDKLFNMPGQSQKEFEAMLGHNP